jgi:arginase
VTVTLVAAPSNLGLSPPRASSVPGCAKAPEALREAGLHRAMTEMGAIDGGVIIPGRYVDDAGPGTGRLRNQDAIVDHSRRLADRLGIVLDRGDVPLVVGGDCSILVAAGIALARRGRYGLVHLDGHTDFRHPGNSERCASLAGEDLAAAVGRHWPVVADIDGLGPYFQASDVVQVGCRDDDEHLAETRALLAAVVPASVVRAQGPAAVVASVLDLVTRPSLDGFWLHLDVDILDPTHMPAVDSPGAGGLTPGELVQLLDGLAPAASGAEVTIYDPDLDPTGRHAASLSGLLAEGLQRLGTSVT